MESKAVRDYNYDMKEKVIKRYISIELGLHWSK